MKIFPAIFTLVLSSKTLASELERSLQTEVDCSTAVSDWITCLTTNCVGAVCEDPPATDGADSADCPSLVSNYCSAFDTICCPVCADAITRYRDCSLTMGLGFLCPGATCDGDMAGGTPGGDPAPTDAMVASTEAMETPTNAMDPAGDTTTIIPIPTFPPGGFDDIPTFPPGFDASAAEDGDICEEESAMLEKCAEEKCPQCKELDDEEMSMTSFSCEKMFENICASIDKGKSCCPQCIREIDTNFDCYFSSELIGSFCPDSNGCDGINSGGSSGGTTASGGSGSAARSGGGEASFTMALGLAIATLMGSIMMI